MQQQKKNNLSDWVDYLSSVEIPVLKPTVCGLSALRQDEKNLSARSIAHIIKYDPMMTAKLLRYLQQHKRIIQEHEVVEVEQALIMLGLETSLEKYPRNH